MWHETLWCPIKLHEIGLSYRPLRLRVSPPDGTGSSVSLIVASVPVPRAEGRTSEPEAQVDLRP